MIYLSLSVRPPARNTSASTGQTFIKFDIRVFFENLSRKFKFHYNLTRMTETLHEDQYIFLIISRSTVRRMRSILEKSCRENQNMHCMFNDFIFENRAVYEIMWKNIVKPDRPQTTIWRMRIACWIPKATNTQSEHELLLSTATIVSLTRLNLTLYANFLSSWCKSVAKTFSGFSRQYVATQVVNLKTEAVNYPHNRRLN